VAAGVALEVVLNLDVVNVVDVGVAITVGSTHAPSSGSRLSPNRAQSSVVGGLVGVSGAVGAVVGTTHAPSRGLKSSPNRAQSSVVGGLVGVAGRTHTPSSVSSSSPSRAQSSVVGGPVGVGGAVVVGRTHAPSSGFRSSPSSAHSVWAGGVAGAVRRLFPTHTFVRVLRIKPMGLRNRQHTRKKSVEIGQARPRTSQTIKESNTMDWNH